MTALADRVRRLRSPAAATATAIFSLATLVALLIASVFVPGAAGSFASSPSTSAIASAGAIIFGLSFTAVGWVVSRRLPRNPLGWLLLGVALSINLGSVAPAYAYLDYGRHHGALPLGPLAVMLSGVWFYAFALLPLAILLFPDGRVGPRWRLPLRAYGVVVLALTAALLNLSIQALSLRLPVDAHGNLSGLDHVSGWTGPVLGLTLVSALLIAVSAIARQALSFRRAGSERRQQLKWLTSGAAICFATAVAAIVWPNPPSVVSNLLLPIGFVSLPLSIGVGILRYRLYEIDRLVSRTLSWLVLTGLLAGTFIALVALTTNTLALSGRVGVAASTLAAAALFNPLRGRVQRIVDRRFNRARYDAEATVAAFTAGLRDAVEIDAIAGALRDAVDRAVQPTHASVWIRP